MKNIFLTIFTAMVALTLTVTAKAALTCGVPGTEGLPSCSAVANPNEKCCIPPVYKGIKTVVKPGNKTTLVNSPNNTAVQNPSYAQYTQNNENFDMAPTPVTPGIVPNKIEAAPVAQVQVAPNQTAETATSGTPSAPAAPAPTSAVSASAVKVSSSK
ncbi:MAG: hypothetical protein J5594_01755 [Elusimicrobiaceae bacterium]|nr:hypothetical protein [Elusimicrobiaceae bacterium]